MMKKIITLIILFATAQLSITCNQPSKKVQNKLEPKPENPKEIIVKKSLPDLKITHVKIMKNKNKTDEWDKYQIVVTIVNNGETPAKDFDCVVNYNCPAGLTTNGGNVIVQGGYIAGKSEFVYAEPFHIYCEPIPAFIDFRFEVDPDHSVSESNEKNNKLNLRMAIPF